jgi:hypothetical protein
MGAGGRAIDSAKYQEDVRLHEPEFYNYTPFRSELLPLIDKDGAECRVAVTKATFALKSPHGCVLHDEQRAIRYGDEMWGKPEIPDIKFPGDLCAFKPGTDFVVVGEACASLEKPAKSIDVEIQVDSRRKTLRAYGPRFWRKELGTVTLSEPQPAAQVTLCWANAYGGLDLTEPEKPLEEPLNPVGNGVANDRARLVDTPAFQIEDPAQGSLHPAGCSAIGRSYEPRRSYAGNYDAAWLRNRYPARPADYHDEHENCAPPDQVFPTPLTGGESVHLTHMNPASAITFQVPRLRVEVEAVIDGKSQVLRPHLDTLLVDASSNVVELVWRASFRCPPKMRNHFEAVRVLHKEFV